MLREVIVCVDRFNPPYVSDTGDGNVLLPPNSPPGLDGLHGATITLVQRAFASQRVEVTFFPTDGPLAQAVYLAAGRADLAADITITERRRRWFTFSRPYAFEELQVLALHHGPLWPGWRSFTGSIGAKADSYAQEYLIRHHNTVPAVVVDSTERLLEALREGRVQAIVLSRVTAAALLAGGAHPDIVPRAEPFGPAPLALAALPGQDELLDQFNAGLTATGGAGSYAHLLQSFPG